MTRVFKGSMNGFALEDGADLQKSEFGEQYRWTEMRRAKLRMADARWSKFQTLMAQDSDLSGVDMTEAILKNVHFDRCDLSEATFDRARFSDVSMVSANLSGASFAGSDLGRSGGRTVAVGFEHADLSGADLRGCNLTRCRLEGANFDGALLDDAVFSVGQLAECPSLMNAIVSLYLSQRAGEHGAAALCMAIESEPLISPDRGMVHVRVEPLPGAFGDTP